MNYCFVVPHFNHIRELQVFLPHLIDIGLPIYLVDDGSCSDEVAQLRKLVDASIAVRLIEMGQNRGKGAAVMLGFGVAMADGFSHVIQIDADGQHDLDDLHHLLACSKASPSTIVSGRPVFDNRAPNIRVYGRKITNFWTALETLSFSIKDALCGFRIYPLAEVARVTDGYHIGPRMDFDTDILVKAIWCGIPLSFVDTRVIYIEDGTSHFHYFRDNLRLISLHVRLVAGMLVRLPKLLWQRWCRPGTASQ